MELDTVLAGLGTSVPLRHAVSRMVRGPASPIQRAALPDALRGRDLLAVAPTGSGKTLVTAITLAHRLAGAPSLPGRPRALLLAPTRELADQHLEVLSEVFSGAGLWAARPAPAGSGVRPLPPGPVDALVGTPGRLAALVRSGELDTGRVLVIALDEVDGLLAESFLAQTRAVLSRCPGTATVLATTATADAATTAELERVRPGLVVHRAGSLPGAGSGPEPATGGAVDHGGDGGNGGGGGSSASGGGSGNDTGTTVDLLVVSDPAELLVRIAPRLRRALVFVPRRDQTAVLRTRLDRAGVRAADIHGAASPTRRTEALGLLAAGRVPVLVTTDLTGRGLDLPRLREVVHVGLPHSVEDLVHRSGRTGRGGQPPGLILLLVAPHEARRAREMAREAAMVLREPTPDAATLDRLLGPAPRAPRTRPEAARSPARGRRPKQSRRHRPKRARRDR